MSNMRLAAYKMRELSLRKKLDRLFDEKDRIVDEMDIIAKKLLIIEDKIIGEEKY